MTRNTAYERHQRLLGIIQEHAPNGTAAEKAAKIYNDMMLDNLSDRLIEQRLTGMLYDGLAYGNWPWLTAAHPSPAWYKV